jgi:hypothetical protein
MAARNWRLIDIDQYEDGILTMEDLVDPDPRSPQEAASEAKNKSSEVRSLLQKWVLCISSAASEASNAL